MSVVQAATIVDDDSLRDRPDVMRRLSYDIALYFGYSLLHSISLTNDDGGLFTFLGGPEGILPFFISSLLASLVQLIVIHLD